MSLVYTILSSSFSVYHFDSLFMWDTMDARPPCPSPFPRVCPSSCPLNRWYIQPSHPLLPFSPSAFNLSQHWGLFQCIRWPNYWSFNLSISPSNEYSGLISFRIDWFDLFAVQEVFFSTTIWKYQFFGAQLSLSFNSHIHTWLLEKPWLRLDGHLSASNVSAF